MTARRPSNVTSAKPRRSPRTRISSVKKPPRRVRGSARATARITVVLPTPGRPVSRRATAPPRSVCLDLDAFDAVADADDRTNREGRAGAHGRTAPNAAAGAWGDDDGRRRHAPRFAPDRARSEEHTSELQSRTLISYAVFC